MIKYICKHCDGLLCESSICPVCGNRTEIYSTAIYYCSECNAPCFEEECPVHHSKNKEIGKDLRPVFAQERLLIEVLLGKPMEFAGKSVWSTASNTFWVNGGKVTFSISDLKKADPKLVIQELEKYKDANQQFVDHDFDNEHIQKFIEINRYRLNQITEEAINHIKEISKGFEIDEMFVSFSGGKDSTVTSNLVLRAFGTEKIVHIYGDTTLEYPESEKYLSEFRKLYPQTPILVAKNRDQQFNDLCEVVGPPSRVMRWCCTVFKTGAITKKMA